MSAKTITPVRNNLCIYVEKAPPEPGFRMYGTCAMSAMSASCRRLPADEFFAQQKRNIALVNNKLLSELAEGCVSGAWPKILWRPGPVPQDLRPAWGAGKSAPWENFQIPPGVCCNWATNAIKPQLRSRLIGNRATETAIRRSKHSPLAAMESVPRAEFASEFA